MRSYTVRVPLSPGSPLYDLCRCDRPESVAAIIAALLPAWDWQRGTIEIACGPDLAQAGEGPPPWKEV
jgi:hypothetical protein